MTVEEARERVRRWQIDNEIDADVDALIAAVRVDARDAALAGWQEGHDMHCPVYEALARVRELEAALAAVRRLYFEEDSFPAMEGEDSEYAHAVEDILGKINVIAATALERALEGAS